MSSIAAPVSGTTGESVYVPPKKPTPRSVVPGTETFLLTSGSAGSNGFDVTPAVPL